MPRFDEHPICAVRRTAPAEADRILADAVDYLRRRGARLAGVLQQDTQRAGRRRCDMDLIDIADGHIIRISEDRGNEARGCRLKADALTEVSASLCERIAHGVDFVVLNKFGKAEAEGRGLRDVIVAAVEAGTPLIVGVKPEYVSALDTFAGGSVLTMYPDLTQIIRCLDTYIDLKKSAA